ncbi:MAG: hypothetical protein JNJ75_17705 [Cyclobacteriaceae bacterium]|nr:hypothetical protein [Cyclobacteriaceae bacterium]
MATITKDIPAVKPAIDVDVLTSIDPNSLTDSYVYVHCHYQNVYDEMFIRIWQTTFLIDRVSGSRAKLVHVENISYAPVWTHIPGNQLYTFLLIFSSLPKDCKTFDLVEDIPQAGGFFVSGISRNEQDVYHVTID